LAIDRTDTDPPAEGPDSRDCKPVSEPRPSADRADGAVDLDSFRESAASGQSSRLSPAPSGADSEASFGYRSKRRMIVLSAEAERLRELISQAQTTRNPERPSYVEARHVFQAARQLKQAKPAERSRRHLTVVTEPPTT